jgi:hypothetical protein
MLEGIIEPLGKICSQVWSDYSHHTYVFYPLKAELGNILILMNYFTLVLEFHLFSVPKLHYFAILPHSVHLEILA